MARIFDALNRKSGDGADPVLAALVREFQAESAAAAQPMEVPLAPGSPVFRSPQPDGAAIRTLPLSIPLQSPLLPFDGENGHAAEQYRIARTRIIQHPRQPRMIVVSSAGPADGKTLCSINLSGALALKTEGNVLLVDADFRRCAVHERLGLPAFPGLSDVLAGACPLEETLVRAEQFPNLYILPAGGPSKNPTELLDTSRWRALAKVLRAVFHFVIVDSTPIAAVADYDLIEAVCDGVLLVARPDHTVRKACLQAIAAIPKDKLVGVLLNCVPNWFLTRPHYHYGAYYYQPNGGQR